MFPYVTSGDGFHPDGSFIFHDSYPYIGGYGVQLIGTMGPLMQWLTGSTWEVTDPMRTNLFRWIHEACAPFIYKGAMMQMVSGRYYTRDGDDHVDGNDVLAAILRVTQFAPSVKILAIAVVLPKLFQVLSFCQKFNNGFFITK